ncbi:hypothetical protein [Ottowia testudinis]|uniref:Uncharacterized protein n=1 Tax=Ottowia testudinis TaxID=2816950 RepID=A0A975H206_9BURK|nr:hypothetical protein [Ottowia testudinis]QTD44299.1 hypothetical protein J1M35_14420 [Ottowia testudinis]
MSTSDKISQLIDEAAEKTEGLRALGRVIGVNPSSLIEMRQGKRPANWRVRGKLRAVLGEDPAHAFMAAMAEDLAASDNEDEKKAASSFEAMLAAFADQRWRKR